MKLRRNMTTKEKQKRRKCLRTAGRRAVCGLLSLAMVAQSGAGISMAAAAPEKAPTYLKSSRISSDQLPEGDWLYFGTAAATVAEHGEYAIRVYREGNLKKVASVELRTIDMTAIYGEDYELVGNDTEDLQENSTGKTLLEMYTKGQEITHTDDSAVANLLLDAGQNTPEKALTEAAAAITAENAMNTEASAETSSLAALKEAQTGEATRELTETEDKGFMDAVAQQMLDDSTTDAMQNLTASSVSKISFAKGESEKVVRFRILEDKESEGTEGFTLLLADPDGAELYQVGTAGITIEDDEKSVRSEVSFSEKEYRAKDGKVTFTVKRTGAEYSVCDMLLMTSEDTAVAGENYTEKCETLSFAPYETEKTVEMDVSGTGKFSVLLTELKACEEGEYTKAVITIPQENDVSNQESTAKTVKKSSDKGSNKKASDTEEQNFGITLNRKSYTVYYKMGDTYGRIMDEGYNPPIEVGRYFFPQDKNHGGVWTYKGFGDKPNTFGHRRFEYHVDSNTRDSMVNNYGDLSYKHTSAWCKGGSEMTTIEGQQYKDFGLAAVYYQFASPDIMVKKDARFRIYSDAVEGIWETSDDQSRSQDVGPVKLCDSDWKACYLRTHDTNSSTCTFEINLYGITAMYRKLNIKVQNPEKLTYRTGKDSTIEMEPANMTVKCGAQPNPLTAGTATRDVYANPNADDTNFVFSPGSMSLNGHQGIFGYIKGYDITIDNKTQNDKVNVTYPEDYINFLNSIRNKDTARLSFDTSSQAIDAVIKKVQENTSVVPYDAYFFHWLGKLTSDGGYNNNVVASDGLGWKHKLVFKPKMAYYDVNVKVLPAALGEESVTDAAYFEDESLKANQTYTFHAGDSIDLSVKSKDENQYHAVGYQVSTDNGNNWNTITNTKSLMLEYDKEYLVRPIVTATNNCIEVRFADKEAEDRFEIQGLIPVSQLKGTDMEGKNVLLLDPNASTTEKKVEPVVGGLYTVRVVVKDGKAEDSDGYVYRPVIKNVAQNESFNTQYMEMSASGRVGDNVIEVSCSRVKKSELKTYTIRGMVQNRQNPIRQSGSNKDVQAVPAAESTVSVSKGTQSTGVNKNTGETTVNVDTAVAEVGDDGEYILQGIIATDGDKVPLCIGRNGELQRIQAVYIGGNGKTSDGQDLVVAETTTLYPSSELPKVVMLDYDYEKADNRQKQGGNTENTVHIYDDTFIMTAVVDPKGRKIKEAVFTVYHFGKADKYEEYRVKEEAGNPNTFVCTIPKMAESFHNGDGVRIQLIDAEDSVLWQYDENGNLILDDEGNAVQGQTVENAYPAQDSGLTFYIENELIYPQTYDVETSPTANVPLIGSATSNTSSGLLTFGKSWWDKDKTGYTLQIGVDALWSETPSSTTSQKRDGYQNLHKTVRDATQMESIAKNVPNAEEIIMGLGDEDYFSHFTDDEFNESAEEYDSYNAQLAGEKEKMQDIVDTIKNDATSKAKQARASMTKPGAWSIDIALLLAFDFVYNPVDEEYVFSCGTVTAGGSFTYNKTMYTIVSSVPAFLNFSATLQLNGLVSYTTSAGQAALSADDFSSYAGNLTERLANPQAKVSIMVSGKIQIGVGMCGVLSARGYASIKLQFDIPLTQKTQGGVLLGATGGIGFDLLVISINLDIVNASYGTGSLANQTHVDFFGGLASIETKTAKASRKGAGDTEDKLLKEYSDSEKLTAHTYSGGTSDMSTFGKIKNKKATLSAVSVTPLLENAAERTRPQIIPLDNGKKMMVFIANRNSGKKDDYVLNYALYDGTKWQTPAAVADDGTIDSTPDILKAGGKVIIAWADANRVFTETDSNIDKLSAMDISVAVYDIESGVMGEKKALTKDGLFDLSPQLALDNENIYCSYMKRDLSTAGNEADLTDFSKIYSTMAYATYDYKTGVQADEKYISIKHENLTDPVVLDYQSVIMEENGDTYLVATYTVDEDKDLNTNEDRELFLSIYNIDKDRTYYPIRLSLDKINQSAPKLTDIDGIVYLTWLENGYIFKLADVSTLMDGLFNTAEQEFEVDVTDKNGRDIKKNVTIDKSKYINAYMTSANENREWYKKTAQELGMDSDVYEGTVYESLTENKIPTDGANFNQNEDIQESVGNYQLVSNGDDVYVFFTNAGSEHDSTGVEIYGVRYQRALSKSEGSSSMDGTSADDREATHWGFGKSVQLTHANKVIDELDLYMTEDSKVSAVSNYFDQWIDGTGKIQYSANQLVEIEFEPKGSVEVKDSTVTLPESFVAGDTQPISFYVENTGLLPSKGFDYTVSQVAGGKETVIASGHEDCVLFAGEKQQVYAMWKIPENLGNTEIKITVKETGVDSAQPDVAIRKVAYKAQLIYKDSQLLWNEDGRPYIKATIRNKGNAASKAYRGELCRLDENSKPVKTYATFDVPALKSGEETQIEIPFTPDVEDFSHLGIIDLSLRIYDGDKLIMNKLTQLASSVPVCAKIGDGKDISLKGDESVTLQAIAAPWGEAFGTPKYSSSNSSVAVVDANGKVTTKGNGEAILYADYPKAGVTASVKVNVSGKATNGTDGTNSTDGNGGDTQDKAATKKITLKKKSVVIAPGKSKSVKFTATKAASVDNAAAVTAKSSNTKVVKAKVSGGKLKLTAVKNAAKGAKATVTLKSVNANGKTVSANIKVSIRNKTKKLQAAKKTLTVKQGKTAKLTLNVTAENKKKPTTDTAKVKGSNVALAKASAKKGKIVVSLKGKKKGTKKVTLQVGDKKVSVMVKVQ